MPGSGSLVVLDQGQQLTFTFAAMMDYHGPGSPGGVAHAFKVMERAFALLAGDPPPERRELVIETAFGGPGARDGFELVTRAVTGGRYTIEPALERPERGRTLERFVFRLGYRDRTVTLQVQEGFVPDELIELTRRAARTEAEELRLTEVKARMADRVMGAAADDVYDVVEGQAPPGELG